MTLGRRSRVEIPLRHASEATPVPIIGDGLVATGLIGEGRHIPLLILDTSSRQDIETMVQAHPEFGQGDVTSIWTFNRRLFGLASPLLLLKITKPSECVVLIEFDMTQNHGLLIDQILWAQGVYLQPGRPGDRVTTTLDIQKILVEVPRNKHFESRFQPLYERTIIQHFRKKGMNRTDAKQAARTFLTKWRSMAHCRLRFANSSSGGMTND